MENNKKQQEIKEGRMPHLWEALLSLAILIGVLAVGIIIYGVDPHVPMFVGACAAALMALKLGYKWDRIEKMMMDGIYKALQSVIILIIIGILVGIWVDAGVVPAMIYYGLKIIHPSIFLIAALIICSITSLATGTSWGTVGTMGIALMGISLGLGINPAATAGACLSGAYFGDKMSPLSDTTNLAPAMAGTDVITHVKFMILPTVVAYTLSIIFFGALGFHYYQGGGADLSSVAEISNALKASFTINPFLLVPPVVVIVCVAMKMPAIPGIAIGAFVGAVMGALFGNSNLGTILDCGMNGFVSETGLESVDNLLSTGGLMNMMNSVSMTLIAMMFGGIMEDTKQLQVIVNKLKPLANTPAKLVILTEVTCFASNATMPEQYISIVVPGRMYAEEYHNMGLHPKTLSNALEGAGTVSGAMIPWNTCGVYMSTTLKMSVGQYLPYLFFNYTMPIVVAIMALVGLTCADMEGNRLNAKQANSKEVTWPTKPIDGTVRI